MRKVLAVVAALAVFFGIALAFGDEAPANQEGDDATAKALSKMLDELYRSKTARGRMTMKVVTPNYQRTLTMSIWSRGMEDTLVRILSPRKEKGTATLKKGNEMWNYLPKIRKTIRIPPSMMMGSWMGSDFTNDDLVRETSWERDYYISFAPSPPQGQIGLVYRPKPEAPVTWSKVVAWLNTKTNLPLKMEYFDEKKRLVRIMVFDQIKELGGRRIPSRLTLTPLSEDKKGHSTTIIYSDMEFDKELSPNLFSLTNLRQGR